MNRETRGVHNQFRKDVVAHMPKLKLMALSLCRNIHQAEDLVQDTVIKALEKEHQFTEGTSLISWLSTILKTVHLDSLRRKRTRDTRSPDYYYLKGTFTADDPFSRMELADTLKALKSIPQEQSSAILDRADGMSVELIAKKSGIPVGTVKSRISRGREALRGNV